MIAGCCLLFCYLLFAIVRCLLFVGECWCSLLLFMCRCGLFVVCCWLFAGCCWLLFVCGLFVCSLNSGKRCSFLVVARCP